MPPKKRFITCEICGYRASRSNNEKRMFMARFPLDEARCKQWVKFVGKEDLIYVPIEKLHTLKYVCGNHFHNRAFNKKKNRLKNCAIPSKNLKADPLSDEMLLEFPCHIYSNIDFTTTNTSQGISDNETSLFQAGPGNSDSCTAGPQLLAQESSDKKEFKLRKRKQSLSSGYVADQVPHLDSEPAELETEEAELPNCTTEENGFSWEVTSDAVSIPQDDLELLDDDRDDLSMYCDDDAAKEINRTGLQEGFHCDNCNGDIVGYRYTCVQCSELDLCASCESSGAHAQHYMLRVPGPRPYNEIQSVLRKIRKLLMKEFDPISTADLDDEDIISLKSEIKSEDEKENVEDTEEIDDITEDAVEPETEELSRPTSPEPQYSENANCDVIMENNVPVKQQLNILDTSLINEQENQKPLVESTDNRESTVANTAKRKLVVRLSDCVKLNLYNQFGKKLCVAPSISKQDIKETNTILCNRTVLDHSKVKYVRLAPSVLLNRGQTVPLQILSPWKPQTNSADGNS